MDAHLRPVPPQASEDEGALVIEQPLDFEAFYAKHRRRLFTALCLVTGNRDEAEEVMQDAFVRVYERWHSVGLLEDPSASAYLFRTAMNVFRNRLRRVSLTIRRTLTQRTPTDDLAAVEDRDALVRAMRGMNPQQRAAIVLTAFLDFSSEDAGKVLGMKAATVRTLAARGRRSIKDHLEDLP